jgi:hypothetical protein
MMRWVKAGPWPVAGPGAGNRISAESARRTTEDARRQRKLGGHTVWADSGCGITRRRPGMKLYAGAGLEPGTPAACWRVR